MVNLATLDAFSKSMAGAHERTGLGGVVSVLAYVFMAYLFISEFIAYQEIRVVEKLLLDVFSEQKSIDPRIDITFLSLSCDQIHMLYRNQHNPKYVEDLSNNFTKTSLSEKSCRVHGTLSFPKIAGILEVSPTKNDFHSGTDARKLTMEDLSEFNASHKITSISFGEPVPGMSNPLDGQEGIKSDGVYQYQYQVKVVPTIYFPLRGPSVVSNQYSSTFYFKRSIDANDPLAQFGLLQHYEVPGLFIRFEFSAISIEKHEVKKSFLQFLTSVCAIVGGVYAVGGLVDLVLHQSLVAKKLE